MSLFPHLEAKSGQKQDLFSHLYFQKLVFTQSGDRADISGQRLSTLCRSRSLDSAQSQNGLLAAVACGIPAKDLGLALRHQGLIRLILWSS
jgi:hypothetical protein